MVFFSSAYFLGAFHTVLTLRPGYSIFAWHESPSGCEPNDSLLEVVF